MNRGQLRSALISRLGIPPVGDGLLDQSELNNIIGYALRDLSSEHDWPWLLTSASLTFTSGVATSPSTLVKVRDLVVNGRRAKYVPLTAFLDASAAGVECVWTDTGTSIRLTPAPSTAPTATLWYVQGEPALGVDTASPLVPDAHHQMVVARASYLANTRRNRMEEAQRDDNEYQMGLRKMRDASWSKTGPRTVRPAGVALWASW